MELAGPNTYFVHLAQRNPLAGHIAGNGRSLPLMMVVYNTHRMYGGGMVYQTQPVSHNKPVART